MGVIYKLTSPIGRVYVGKTRNLKRRISDYKYKLNGRHSIIINSIKKYGWKAHLLEIIEELEESRLDEREIFWIKELKTYNQEYPEGMNLTRGGEGQRSTWMHDIERRKRQSERFSGSGGSFYGKHHTEENKAASSKRAREYNLKNGIRVPEWGAEKGREVVRRKVVCYSSDGKLLSEYPSMTAASKALGVHNRAASDSIKWDTWVEGKYKFRYKTENYPLTIEVGEINMKTVKRPVICFVGSWMLEYPSSAEASIDLGVPKTTINRAAQYNNGRPIRKGKYRFIYSDKLDSLKITA